MSNLPLPYALKVVFGMINGYLKDPIDHNDVILSMPTYVPGELNTRIQVKPKISTGLYGNFDFYYKRIDLAAIEDVEVIITNQLTTRDLIPNLNSESLFFISMKNTLTSQSIQVEGMVTPEEIVNSNLPAFTLFDTQYIDVKAMPGSYLFTGKTKVKLKRN